MNIPCQVLFLTLIIPSKTYRVLEAKERCPCPEEACRMCLNRRRGRSLAKGTRRKSEHVELPKCWLHFSWGWGTKRPVGRLCRKAVLYFYFFIGILLFSLIGTQSNFFALFSSTPKALFSQPPFGVVRLRDCGSPRVTSMTEQEFKPSCSSAMLPLSCGV